MQACFYKFKNTNTPKLEYPRSKLCCLFKRNTAHNSYIHFYDTNKKDDIRCDQHTLKIYKIFPSQDSFYLIDFQRL